MRGLIGLQLLRELSRSVRPNPIRCTAAAQPTCGKLAGCLLVCSLAGLLPHLPAFLLAARMADLLACLLPGCHASWLPGFARIGALDAIIVLVGLVFV